MRNHSILARADALMNRRRQAPAPEDVPVLTEAVAEEEDDIPVLLNPENANHPPMTPAGPQPSLAKTHREAPEDTPSTQHEHDDHAHDEMVIRELTRRLSKRLVAELPRLIEATLRDFVAEQEEIARQQSDD